MKKTEIFVIVLGFIGLIILLVSLASTESGNIRGLGSAFLLLPHLIIMLISIPFLIDCTYKAERISKYFVVIVALMSILNALFMIGISFGVFERGDLVIPAIIELLPILFFYQNRIKIS